MLGARCVERQQQGCPAPPEEESEMVLNRSVHRMHSAGLFQSLEADPCEEKDEASNRYDHRVANRRLNPQLPSLVVACADAGHESEVPQRPLAH